VESGITEYFVFVQVTRDQVPVNPGYYSNRTGPWFFWALGHANWTLASGYWNLIFLDPGFWVLDTGSLLIMLKICVLGSGSSGNCTWFGRTRRALLIDCGRLSYRYVTEQLAALEIPAGG